MIPSDVPERPWQTVGSDLFELNGSSYLLVVDYLWAFVEIAKFNNTSSASIVNNLNPVLVTDVHCICLCSRIHSQNKQSKIYAIKWSF